MFQSHFLSELCNVGTDGITSKQNTYWCTVKRVYEPLLKLTLVADVERWLSYKGTCHVILLAKLHDMYLYKKDASFASTTIQRWLSYTDFTVVNSMSTPIPTLLH